MMKFNSTDKQLSPAANKKIKMIESDNLLKSTYLCLTSRLPVFPDVGSINVVPGFNIPFLSASSTIRSPILSLTEPPELKYSHFTTAKRFQNCFINKLF